MGRMRIVKKPTLTPVGIVYIFILSIEFNVANSSDRAWQLVGFESQIDVIYTSIKECVDNVEALKQCLAHLHWNRVGG